MLWTAAGLWVGCHHWLVGHVRPKPTPVLHWHPSAWISPRRSEKKKKKKITVVAMAFVGFAGVYVSSNEKPGGAQREQILKDAPP